MTLVGPESPSEQARRVFQSFDPEGDEHLCMLYMMYMLIIVVLPVSQTFHCSPPTHLFLLLYLLISTPAK